MNQLSEILAEKGHQVLEIEADASVFEAVKQMIEANVGSLLVTRAARSPASSPSAITSAG